MSYLPNMVDHYLALNDVNSAIGVIQIYDQLIASGSFVYGNPMLSSKITTYLKAGERERARQAVTEAVSTGSADTLVWTCSAAIGAAMKFSDINDIRVADNCAAYLNQPRIGLPPEQRRLTRLTVLIPYLLATGRAPEADVVAKGVLRQTQEQDPLYFMVLSTLAQTSGHMGDAKRSKRYAARASGEALDQSSRLYGEIGDLTVGLSALQQAQVRVSREGSEYFHTGQIAPYLSAYLDLMQQEQQPSVCKEPFYGQSGTYPLGIILTSERCRRGLFYEQDKIYCALPSAVRESVDRKALLNMWLRGEELSLLRLSLRFADQDLSSILPKMPTGQGGLRYGTQVAREPGVLAYRESVPPTLVWRSLARARAISVRVGGRNLNLAESLVDDPWTTDETPNGQSSSTASLVRYVEAKETLRMERGKALPVRLRDINGSLQLRRLCASIDSMKSPTVVVDIYRVKGSVLTGNCAPVEAVVGSAAVDAQQERNLSWMESRGWRVCTADDVYVAFVVDQESCTSPSVVSLGPAPEIDALVAEWGAQMSAVSRGALAAEATRTLQTLSRRLLDPIEGVIEGKRDIYIVADGAISVAPWSALSSRAGRLVLEDHVVRTLDDVFEVEPDPTNEPIGDVQSVALVGDVDYNALTLNDRIIRVAEDRTPGPVAGWPCYHVPLEALPATSKEVDGIADLLLHQPRRSTPAVLRGSLASESAVRDALSSRQIIHFATHGFFPSAAGGCSSDVEMVDSWRGGSLTWSGAPTGDPSLLSALALSGANLNVAAEAEPGVGLLTAWEIARMDLSKVQLVVLDACGTALGELSTLQGANSLRLAFRQAGARHVVSTLTPIADGASRELLLDFYRGVLAGKPPTEALRDAQLAMLNESRAAGRGPRPERWAPWIVSGL